MNANAVTKSNEWSGKRTFDGRCLHNIEQPHILNPYEDVIETIGKTLRDFGACTAWMESTASFNACVA